MVGERRAGRPAVVHIPHPDDPGAIPDDRKPPVRTQTAGGGVGAQRPKTGRSQVPEASSPYNIAFEQVTAVRPERREGSIGRVGQRWGDRLAFCAPYSRAETVAHR